MRLIVEMTGQNDDGSENQDRAEFCLGFIAEFYFFFASSFVLKRESFLVKRFNRRLFLGPELARRVFAYGLLQISVFFELIFVLKSENFL